MAIKKYIDSAGLEHMASVLHDQFQTKQNINLLIKEKELYLIAPAGYISTNDKVLFARYKRTFNHKTKDIKYGWIVPGKEVLSKKDQMVKLFLRSDIAINNQFKHTIMNGFDVFKVECGQAGDTFGIGKKLADVFYEETHRDKRKVHFETNESPCSMTLTNVKCGIRIYPSEATTADNKPKTDWLVFKVQDKLNHGLSRWM